MANDVSSDSELKTQSSSGARSRGRRVMELAEGDARTLVYRIRPRISLAGGSLLVLLTLFLPIGYSSCGPKTMGYELVRGKGEWPTFLGIFVSEPAGQAFYILLLAIAAFTAIFVLPSFKASAVSRKALLNRRLFLVTATVSLFLISDVFVILPPGEERYGSAAFALGLISILGPGFFWPKKVFAGWLGALVITIAVFFVADALGVQDGSWKSVPSYLFVAIYALAPIGLWWLGVAASKFDPAQWLKVRRGLVAYYLPAVLGNLWFFVIAWREGVWGFVPCVIGIHLMTIGYMRFATAAERSTGDESAVPEVAPPHQSR